MTIFIQLIKKGAWLMNREDLEFVTFCVGSLALRLNLTRAEAFKKLDQSGVLNGYLVPCYNVLHTFDEEYIVDELIGVMQRKGVEV